MSIIFTVQKHLKETLTEYGYHLPDKSYFLCAEASGMIVYILSQFGIDAEVLEAYLSYPKDSLYAPKEMKKKKQGHYMVLVKDQIWDFTLRQFLPESDFPFISEMGSEEAKNVYGKVSISHRGSLYFVSFSIDGSSETNKEIADKVIKKIREEKRI